MVVAAILSLLAAELEDHFANKEVFVSSFYLTQPQLYDAVLHATGAVETDWQVERKESQDAVDEGLQKLQAGDLTGTFEALYGTRYLPGE